MSIVQLVVTVGVDDKYISETKKDLPRTGY